MATIAVEGIKKVYANGFEAVKGIDLHVAEGEFMVLVGPSGCGKTTLLRMIAGLEDISDGSLLIDGKIANDMEPKERDIAMVFQNYALYPHMTVAENIGFPLKLRGVPKSEIETHVTEAAKVLGLGDLLKVKPGQLSGGQRQRVAMGRAIVRAPSVFLMDEPLSNLDAKLRVQMRGEVSRIQRRVGVAGLDPPAQGLHEFREEVQVLRLCGEENLGLQVAAFLGRHRGQGSRRQPRCHREGQREGQMAEHRPPEVQPVK